MSKSFKINKGGGLSKQQLVVLVLSVIMGFIVITIVIASVSVAPSATKKKVPVSNVPDSPVQVSYKSNADTITVQSTGYANMNNKYRYGFIISNSQEFTGTITINFDGPNGELKQAVEFNETKLAANVGDIGSVALSGLYDHFTYTITINGQKYEYPGETITNQP